MSTHGRRSLQEWVHWFDLGDGSRWALWACLFVGVLVLSWCVGYKQFRGPATETTMAQAVVGRQLAAGEGFTTLVNYPQTYAWARSMPGYINPERETQAMPEMHQPPLYSMAIAGALRCLPAQVRTTLLGTAPVAPAGFGADYVLLILNVVLLWCAALQVFFLGRSLFGATAGTVAMLALFVSAPIWSATVAVNGTPLTMVVLLALFQCITFIERRLEIHAEGSMRDIVILRGAKVVAAICGIGAACGFLFLADYSAIVAVLVVGVWALRVFSGAMRIRAGILIAAAFLMVSGPWIIRNVLVTNTPLAFGYQGVALKAGDPTAEPATLRETFSTAGLTVSIRKIANKALTYVQRGVGEKFWAGSIFLAAFFVAGLLYRFKASSTRRVRIMVLATVVALALAQAVFDSGENERSVWIYSAPLIMVFGAGFFCVLISSNEVLSQRATLAVVILLAAQAVPLAREMLEPRRVHFSYPPYLPGLFLGMGQEVAKSHQGNAPRLAWMADVPAGVAWYSGERVWAKPATMDGFFEANSWERINALVLTPETLSKPFFTELEKQASEESSAKGQWAHVYRGLVTGTMPEYFPLKAPQRILADDFYVLIETPGTPGTRR